MELIEDNTELMNLNEKLIKSGLEDFSSRKRL
jgi:hypothetical protein